MTWDTEEASFVRFDRYYASRLRRLLLKDDPTIPKVLLDFFMSMENPSNLEVSYNLEDIIPYLVSIVFRVYGFQGTPHVLPYQVPIKEGIAEMLWKIGGLEQTELTNMSRGFIFPSCIMAHQIIITKVGWLFLYKVLDPYKMVVSHARFIDIKGFFEVFK